MKFTLERYSFFPYIAWTLVIGFVFFTYSLTVRLTDSSNSLSTQTEKTERALEGA